MNELVKRGKEYIVERMHAEAYRCFLEAVLSDGDGDAYNWLGRMYLCGWYVRQDYVKAFKYIKLGYEKTGRCIVMFDIMEASRKIGKSKPGSSLCREFFEYMVESGDKNMLITIACEYGIGDIYPRDYNKKIEYLERAVNSGINMGYECLGEMYFKGEGVVRDYRKAYEYFTAFDGYASNMKRYYLAEMLSKGIYIDRDTDKARALLHDIVDSDDPWKTEDEFYQKACELLEKMDL